MLNTTKAIAPVLPGKHLTIGIAVMSVPYLLYLFFGWSIQFWPPESIAKDRKENLCVISAQSLRATQTFHENNECHSHMAARR
jgi:hypothetical protein